MRRMLVFVCCGLSFIGCSATNHLDRYDLHGAPIRITASIDPPPHASDDSSSSSNSSDNIWVSLLSALVVALVTEHPDPLTRNESIAAHLADGFANELHEKLSTIDAENRESSLYAAAFDISDVNIRSNGDYCMVRIKESTTLTHTASGAIVYHASQTIEVPLQYCGSTEDSISISGDPLTRTKYDALREEEQLSALQCSAYDAGEQLADSLASLAERAHHR